MDTDPITALDTASRAVNDALQAAIATGLVSEPGESVWSAASRAQDALWRMARLIEDEQAEAAALARALS